MKNSRKPEYHDKDASIRIVSRPNGFWAVQRNEKPAEFRSKSFDKWQDMFGASALSYDAAKGRMHAEARSR